MPDWPLRQTQFPRFRADFGVKSLTFTAVFPELPKSGLML
jgi:hypothetical protein